MGLYPLHLFGNNRIMNTLTNTSILGKALSDPNRLRLLMMLKEPEVCVCHLITVIGVAPSTISEHLSCLKKAGLITARKEGRWIYYSLRKTLETPFLEGVLENLSSDLTIQSDLTHLQSLLKGEASCQTPTKNVS